MLYQEYGLPSDIAVRKQSNDFLSFVHVNARSLAPKQDQVSAFLGGFNLRFDTVMFSETWYHTESDMLVLHEYNHYLINRSGMRGGGVATHVKQQLSCEVLEKFTLITTDYEALGLLSNSEMFGVVYRPPSGNRNVFLDFIEEILGFASIHWYRLLIGAISI